PTGPPPDAFSTPPYRCRAILLDGPEPLLKNRPDGSSRVQVEARRTATVDAPFGSGSSLDGVRIIAGARGARLFILFDESTPPPAVQIRLRHQRKADDPTTDRILAIEVGDTPGSFDEEVD
ncbi:MAG: hypothetical protein PVG71_13735, partial [Anaerolineae bacterium]